MEDRAEQRRGGWPFPVRVEPVSSPPAGTRDAAPAPSCLKLVDGAASVRQSLCVLLQTQPGERVMRPAYGCDLQSVMFANIDDGLMARLVSRIQESIGRFEPRAKNVEVVVQERAQQAGYLSVQITYEDALSGEREQVRGTLGVADGSGGRFQ